MSEAQKKADKKHYEKKKKTHFKFSKWIPKKNIKPISKAEIEAFCHAKADKEGLK